MSLDIPACLRVFWESLKSFGSWVSLGVFWGSLGVFEGLWESGGLRMPLGGFLKLDFLKIWLFRFLMQDKTFWFLRQDETFPFSHAGWDFLIPHAWWDFLVFSCRMRLSGFLIQNETFWFSHALWDFSVSLLRMRLSRFLIQDETFRFSHAEWDFSVFLCYMRLFVRRMKQTNKQKTLLRPLHYLLAVKKHVWDTEKVCNIAIFRKGKKWQSSKLFLSVQLFLC